MGYGIVSRVLQSVVEEARAQSLGVGLLRPITLWPFPTRRIKELANTAKIFFAVEMSNGQMVDDIRLALDGKRLTKFYGRMGGVVPTTKEIIGLGIVYKSTALLKLIEIVKDNYRKGK